MFWIIVCVCHGTEDQWYYWFQGSAFKIDRLICVPKISLYKLPVKQMARIKFSSNVSKHSVNMGKSLRTISGCPIFRNYCSAQNNSAIYAIWLPSICPKSPLQRVDSAKASDINAVLSCAYISSSFLLFFSLWVFFTPSWTGNAPCLPEQASK